MERTEKHTPSSALFSGDGLASAGNYFIIGAVIVSKPMHFAGMPDKYFDSLQIELAMDNCGKIGARSMHTVQLNGCWRQRKSINGEYYKASGSLFDLLAKECTGKSFPETCEWINSNLKGKHIKINYQSFTREDGGCGLVPIIDFI